ncbi:MAG: amidophosphoribosyltransferase [Rickettsiales bacterium]|nr:amidophosphoribosyltransferase [Rickettsiales bacterium]
MAGGFLQPFGKHAHHTLQKEVMLRKMVAGTRAMLLHKTAIKDAVSVIHTMEVVNRLHKKTTPFFAGVLHGALNTLYPPRCPACQVQVEGQDSLCSTCFTQLSWIASPYCHACGTPFEFEVGDDALCGACSDARPNYTAARSALVYDDASRKLITQYKYADKTERTAAYGRLLQRAAADILPLAELIIPVPLHRRRLWQRKYNQSLLLAYALSELASVEMLADGLVRTRATPPQAGLDKKARTKNVKGAFAVHPAHADILRGKSVLLVDDVITTGATIDACTQALLGARVANVYVVTLAKRIEAT